jgi:hypothetical protein
MENDYSKDDVKSICDIHLQNHSIGIHIQTTQTLGTIALHPPMIATPN